jgi:lipopolysaccharide/colanic/teichoic acid biosynthesis glycosyltransferase
LVPVASGILADGTLPVSLAQLRATLAVRGVPARDVPLRGGALDLTEEAGLVAANARFIRKAAAPGTILSRPLFVGGGQSVHESARISGPVVIHQDVRVGENARIIGPAVIGAGATIGPGAVIAQAAVGHECTVPSGKVVRNGAWFESDESDVLDRRPLSYEDQITKLLAEEQSQESATDNNRRRVVPGIHLPLKRALDVTASALALAVLSPLLLAVAVAVRLESKGSIFYGDKREGLGGRVFRCWKFRTMFAGAHAVQKDLKVLDKMDGPHFKLDHDPRVTAIGRMLRALNLDELPQLFNVLVGEMSLVGPRPSPFRENQVCVPWREARLSVRPGITGFWQVCRHDRSDGDFHQWIEYDLLYVQHISIWLDLRILAATFFTLGGKVGHVPASWLVRSATIEGQAIPSRHARTNATAEPVVTI